MRYSILSPILLFAIASCASGSITPGLLPKGAVSGVYTNADPQSIATCIATALGSSVQTLDDRLVVASIRHPGLTYSVGPNRGGNVYPTQVAITGLDDDKQDAKNVNGCFISVGHGQ